MRAAKALRSLRQSVWTASPGRLQDIAHNPGNKLSNKRQAEFALDGGAWKLVSIK